ncbi:MAG: cytochrome c [Polaromonas sp.]|uniref:c-type cytochrome n=1 Tax=Polaromonas sp. TaxID=1869339 RepID=UPI0027318F8E|nr:cytochrome c [Polaromonas sp.]MDP2255320.1 cytochrome c [Polaromonas sp.]
MPTKQHAVKQGIPRVIAGIATLGFTFSMAVFSTGYAAESSASIAATRRVELVKLVRQDCGSCHGLALKGGLGPALLPEALKDKPPEYLKFVILHGLPHTAMPPWQRFLSEADAEWIVFNLQKGFPGGY